jgi:hypothetical protein
VLGHMTTTAHGKFLNGRNFPPRILSGCSCFTVQTPAADAIFREGRNLGQPSKLYLRPHFYWTAWSRLVSWSLLASNIPVESWPSVGGSRLHQKVSSCSMASLVVLALFYRRVVDLNVCHLHPALRYMFPFIWIFEKPSTSLVYLQHIDSISPTSWFQS